MAQAEIPAELERRIRALETAEGQGEDFDATSWLWLAILGIVLPVIALIWGWVA
ncbi:hypothetical protein [Dongia rigui]|uniref:Uncharacterized protein n=1 Tax=Dongia rigui TaxID=940149 RepID=A0ABU5DW02_9PROT|nr:hypothetical protein [Dongia rigui]MDY0870888.1 hypothetical protein [Dongia rigui]